MSNEMPKRNTVPEEEVQELVEDWTLDGQGTQGVESHYRSLAKAISWRVVALIVTGSVVWGITGEIAFAVTVGILDAAVKIGLYYLHERAWDRLKFGRRIRLPTG